MNTLDHNPCKPSASNNLIGYQISPHIVAPKSKVRIGNKLDEAVWLVETLD